MQLVVCAALPLPRAALGCACRAMRQSIRSWAVVGGMGGHQPLRLIVRLGGGRMRVAAVAQHHTPPCIVDACNVMSPARSRVRDDRVVWRRCTTSCHCSSVCAAPATCRGYTISIPTPASTPCASHTPACRHHMMRMTTQLKHNTLLPQHTSMSMLQFVGVWVRK